MQNQSNANLFEKWKTDQKLLNVTLFPATK